MFLDERAIRVQLLRTAWTGTAAVGAVVATTHPAAAPRTDGDAIVIRSLPPRPSRYGGWNGGQQRERHGTRLSRYDFIDYRPGAQATIFTTPTHTRMRTRLTY
jgi:hypothetical protein